LFDAWGGLDPADPLLAIDQGGHMVHRKGSRGHVSNDQPETISRKRQGELGQFFTQEHVATFMAGLFQKPVETVRLLDAGAGDGILLSAFVRHQRGCGYQGPISVDAYERDELILPDLESNIGSLEKECHVTIEIIRGDFIGHGSRLIGEGREPRYTHAILNPPYRKIHSRSGHRAQLRAIGLETVNLYSGFVGLALAMMEPGGQLVAILPRSFCNGPYFEPFRRFLLSRAALKHIHLFQARDKAFQGDRVLQENVIIRLSKGERHGAVMVSTSSDDRFSDYIETSHAFGTIVLPEDPHQFIHIPTGNGADPLAGPAFRFRLGDLGLSVSTGPVMDYRIREELCAEPEPGAVPLLYPAHFSGQALQWPRPGSKKPNAIRFNERTAKWLLPNGWYTLVRRLSSKEERRRIVAQVLDPEKLPAARIGIENDFNIFHVGKQPLERRLAHGLATYLNSTAVDESFRRFNGHTQVNASDLRALRYPSREMLLELGDWAMRSPTVHQQAIDQAIDHLRLRRD
jgi:tRNA1(Val) A37 N6-methylase TrmN6